jgi:hypothetical protein
MAYDAGGVDSTEATYRALRARYYGSAAYDFGEVPLADVAAGVRARDRLGDALRLYKLNIEFSPRSGFALRQAAGAELAAHDTAAAISHLEKALERKPHDVGPGANGYFFGLREKRPRDGRAPSPPWRYARTSSAAAHRHT